MARMVLALWCAFWMVPISSSARSALESCIRIQPVVRDPWTAKDKARHFFASALIAGGSTWYSKHELHRGSEPSLHFGIGVTLSLGIAKELFDTRKPGGFFSWKDFTADILGVAAGTLVLGRW